LVGFRRGRRGDVRIVFCVFREKPEGLPFETCAGDKE